MKGILIFLSCVLFTLSSQAQFLKDPPYPYYDGHKWGITNWEQQVQVAPQYDSILCFRVTIGPLEPDSFAIVRKKNKLGLVNLCGQLIIPFDYDQIDYLYGDIAGGKQKGKYSLLDIKLHEQVSPAVFDSIGPHGYCDPLIFRVWQNGKQGYINSSSGRVITPVVYDKADYLEGMDTVGLVIKGKKCGLVSLMSGKVLLPLLYDTLIPMSQDDGPVMVVAAHSGNTIKYFDWWWNEVKLPEGTHLNRYNEFLEENKEGSGHAIGTASLRGLYIYKLGNERWKINDEDQAYDPPKVFKTFELNGYSSVKLVSDDERPAELALLLVQKNGKTGIIRPTGSEVIPFIYDNIEKEPHYYKTTLNGKVGLLDKTVLTTIKRPVLKRILEQEGASFEKHSNVGQLNAWLVELPDGKKGFMVEANGRILIPGLREEE